MRAKLPQKYIEHIEGIEVVSKTLAQDFYLHWHDYYEIELITQGEAKTTLNGELHNISNGSAYLVCPGDFHDVRVHKELGIINIRFSEKLLSPLLMMQLVGINGTKLAHLSESDFQSALWFTEKISFEQTHKREYSDDLTKNLLSALMLTILRGIGGKGAQYINENECVRSTLLYMNTRFTEEITLDSLAKNVGLSKNYLSGKFTQATGESFKEYLCRVRIGYAKKLLLSTHMSVTDICFTSGFGSFSNFMREFKKFAGVSPGQYRRVRV